MAIAPETLLEALQWRYATKQFDPDHSIPARFGRRWSRPWC